MGNSPRPPREFTHKAGDMALCTPIPTTNPVISS